MLCISSSKASKNLIRACVLENGDLFVTESMKGANPNRERHPPLKCPVCNKVLGVFDTPRDKNCSLVYDSDKLEYACLPRSCILPCPRCHHAIGVTIMETEIREIYDRLHSRSGTKTES